MESSVRYVQLPNAGQKPALCFRGSKSAYAIINASDGIIRTIEIDLKDYDRAQRVKSTRNGGEDYSPVAFAEAISRMARDRVITARSKLLLEKGAYLKPDDALPAEEIMPTPKNDDEETVEVGLDKDDDVTIDGKANPAIRKVRRLGPKRISREGKAEDAPPRKPAEATGAKRTNGSAGPPRSADRASKPAPILSLPRRPAGTANLPPRAKASREGSGKTLVAALASEAGIAQQPCRVKLRAAGLRAPYDEKNEAACRKALGLPPSKGKK